MNKGRGALWFLSICLSAITLVHVPSAFTAEKASSIEDASSVEEVEEKSSETPATVQEPDSVEETPEGTAQTPEEQQPNKEVTQSPDVFDPSEEISEDFAVAFPVDI